MTCALFGHREPPDAIQALLEKEVRKMIERESCTEFLVGHQGRFDAMAYSLLRRIQPEYPTMCFSVVLACMPGEKREEDGIDYADTIYPEGLEIVPRRFAVLHRNRWMVENSDVIICYVNHDWGGAYQAVAYAEKKKLQIINLA